jgi:transposase
VRGQREIKAEEPGHLAAVRWARGLDEDRVWAIEDCRHVSRRLEQALIAAGERVVRVPPQRMGASRRGEREPGKSDQIDALERELLVLVEAHRPQLLAEIGCGALTAALLIGRTAGAERFASDASFARLTGTAPIPCSSGQRQQHRLDRGGDRQLNSALHIIAITRARYDPATRAYLARKEAEGKTRKGALRCLKRHLARRFHYLLSLPAQSPQHDDPSGAAQILARPQHQATTITGTAPTPAPCLT